jgi:hypothetical protein
MYLKSRLKKNKFSIQTVTSSFLVFEIERERECVHDMEFAPDAKMATSTSGKRFIPVSKHRRVFGLMYPWSFLTAPLG